MNTEKAGVETMEQADVEAKKAMAILAYILFLIPLLAARDSRFATYHANQGLVLFLAMLAVNIVGAIIPLVGWLIITPFGNLAIFILAVIGIVNAAKGQAKPLPLIGGIRLIQH